jgi:DNA-binding SARP family transcriptional activator
VHFRVLGPLELGEDCAVPIAPKPRTMLALLLVRTNAMVPVDLVVDEVWGEFPPPSARDNVRLYATIVRRLLAGLPGEATLVRRGPGYQLNIQPAALDLHGFRDLAGRAENARAAGDLASAAGLLDRALGLWRGSALADTPGGQILGGWRVAVEEERLHALEGHSQVLLDLGDTERALARARELLAAEPLRERGHELLVRARYMAGDIAGALAALDAARRVLDEELGVPPGERLLQLQQALLHREPAWSTGPPTAMSPRAPDRPTAAWGQGVPAQLPPGVLGFAGRKHELAELDAHLAAVRDEPTAVGVLTVSGLPGVGKTALAVHWAHRVRTEFPDGQLYVNLRGFDAAAEPMSPAEVVRGFLEAFEVPPQRVPASVDAQMNLYRTVLIDRRVLVVLDNARDADQVRRLLPGSPGSLVVVTSRHQMPGLVAVEGARPVGLGPLGVTEARALLCCRLGAGRVVAEAGAVDEVVTRCAGLPLALSIVAARASTHPQFSLAEVATELRHAADTLDAFADPDQTTDVRAVFSWSYQSLHAAAAQPRPVRSSRSVAILRRRAGPHPRPPVGT